GGRSPPKAQPSDRAATGGARGDREHHEHDERPRGDLLRQAVAAERAREVIPNEQGADAPTDEPREDPHDDAGPNRKSLGAAVARDDPAEAPVNREREDEPDAGQCGAARRE